MIQSEHTAVLHKTEQQGMDSHIKFAQKLGETMDMTHVYYMPSGLWFDLELPETITVLITPGNLLE